MNEHAVRIRIFAIVGSLRARSSNRAILRAASALVPEGVEILLYEGLGDLPHFNPDLDGEVAPLPVQDLRERLQAADGVLISTPEYAHGVPGAMKNALDWVVGSGEFVGKPVALLDGSPSSTFARASITETLTVMMGRFIEGASVSLQLPSNKIDEAGIAGDPGLAGPLRAALAAFARGIVFIRNEATG